MFPGKLGSSQSLRFSWIILHMHRKGKDQPVKVAWEDSPNKYETTLGNTSRKSGSEKMTAGIPLVTVEVRSKLDRGSF